MGQEAEKEKKVGAERTGEENRTSQVWSRGEQSDRAQEGTRGRATSEERGGRENRDQKTEFGRERPQGSSSAGGSKRDMGRRVWMPETGAGIKELETSMDYQDKRPCG